MARKTNTDEPASRLWSWWPFGKQQAARKTGGKEQREPTPPRDNFRETVESVVIAFVLAFLFRTFEAEAFVIPTGSMAPTLTGLHRDLAGHRACEKCGYEYFVGASEEVDSVTGIPRTRPLLDRFGQPVLDENGKPVEEVKEVIGNGTCPVCRWTMDISPENPQQKNYYSYSGDRILVSKFDYALHEPARWDIIVFKYPNGAYTNYIKRLTGLPNEQLVIYQGDIYTRPVDPQEARRYRALTDLHYNGTIEEMLELERLGDKFEQSSRIEAGGYQIARKPPEKIRATMQIVHDTEYELPSGERNGWPARWGGHYEGQTAWQDVAEGRAFELEAPTPKTEWLYYRHYPLTYNEWRNPQPFADDHTFTPRLITDCTAYNTGLRYRYPTRPTPPLPSEVTALGVHWVGDLMVNCQVEVTQQDGGRIDLQLVRAGERFQCRFDLDAGTATLFRDDTELAACDDTGVQGTGSWELSMANVDRKLVVWANRSQLHFSDGSRQYTEGVEYQAPKPVQPRASDLLPVAVGLRQAAGRVEQLQVWRDIYYLALNATVDYDFSSMDLPKIPAMVSEGNKLPSAKRLAAAQDEWAGFLQSPSQWAPYANTKQVGFLLGPDEFMVLGDNTSKSQDSRLWGSGSRSHVVERKLLIGKALFIYWPHSWEFPWHFTYRSPRWGDWNVPFYPNFGRMQLIR